MNNKPIVSVTLSAYNHEKFIEKAVDSIVSQTYGFENVELIAIDDCSIDNTGKILKELSEKYGFFFKQNEVNQGIAKNKNFAVEKAKGKYICDCASDDYWAVDKLKKQVEYMENNPTVVALGGNALRVNAVDEILPAAHQHFAKKQSYSFNDIIMRNYIINTVTVMIRKEILEKVGLYDKKFKIEDYYMWLKLTNEGYNIDVMNELLAYYRIHDLNTHQNEYLMYSEVKKIIDEYKQHSLYKKAIKKLKKIYFAGIVVHNKWEGIKTIPAAFSNSFFFYRGMAKLLLPFRK